MSNPMPPRAPLRLPSNSKMAPTPEEPSKYSDRFKKAVVPTLMPKPDISSPTEFPSLIRAPVIMPNMVVMPKISFADKVKQMAETEEKAKVHAEAVRSMKQKEEQREHLERERYTSIFRPKPMEDTWSSSYNEEDLPGTPEFGRDEFLQEDDGWTEN